MKKLVVKFTVIVSFSGHALTFFLLVREEERRLRAEKEQEVNSVLRSAQKQMTKEQKEARDNLMQQYGYVADGDDDEEEAEPTELTPRDRRRGKTLPVAGNICLSLITTEG